MAEFSKDIFSFLKKSETLTTAQMGYIEQQPDISERMRAILVDWLIEVHLKFKLKAETLFLTVNLIDRFLERVRVERNKLQLVGVTAMMLASKYEEIYPPQVSDFAYITDRAVSKPEILEMEYHFIQVLDFNLQTTSSYCFLQRLLQLTEVDERLASLSQYLIELPLIEYRMLKYSPSNVASSALFLANKIL